MNYGLSKQKILRKLILKRNDYLPSHFGKHGRLVVSVLDDLIYDFQSGDYDYKVKKKEAKGVD